MPASGLKERPPTPLHTSKAIACGPPIGRSYHSSDTTSQIDYVITRSSDSRGTTKHAAPLVQFPVAGWRQAGHWPIQATVCLQPFRSHLTQKQRLASVCDVPALQQAVAAQSPAAQTLQVAVTARLAECTALSPGVSAAASQPHSA